MNDIIKIRKTLEHSGVLHYGVTDTETGDKFILELNLAQLEFAYSACLPFTKHRETVQKFRHR